MTALQIAYAECASWRTDGKGCLGAIIDDDLQIRRCVPRPRCLLSTPGQRCLYFESCVAPMAVRIENPARRQAFEAAIKEYRLACRLPFGNGRPCPMCARPLEPGRRYCQACAAARRKESTFRAVQRHRVTSKQLRPKCPLEIKDLHGSDRGVDMNTADTPKTAC